MVDNLITFCCGGVYGLVCTAVGQPFDTIKTRMQAKPGVEKFGSLSVGTKLFQSEGLGGLYRGTTPMLLSGGFQRASQFFFYESTHRFIVDNMPPAERFLGLFDYQVLLAGLMGGAGRTIVESPAEYIKVRRQVGQSWYFSRMYEGFGTTGLRNSILFMNFALVTDIWKGVIFPPREGHGGGVSPFIDFAVCANFAWLSIWPLDVVKSQIQSGHFCDRSTFVLLRETVSSGIMFRGLVPGLVRSTIANGLSGIAYVRVQKYLQYHFGESRVSTF